MIQTSPFAFGLLIGDNMPGIVEAIETSAPLHRVLACKDHLVWIMPDVYAWTRRCHCGEIMVEVKVSPDEYSAVQAFNHGVQYSDVLILVDQIWERM